MTLTSAHSHPEHQCPTHLELQPRHIHIHIVTSSVHPIQISSLVVTRTVKTSTSRTENLLDESSWYDLGMNLDSRMYPYNLPWKRTNNVVLEALPHPCLDPSHIGLNAPELTAPFSTTQLRQFLRDDNIQCTLNYIHRRQGPYQQLSLVYSIPFRPPSLQISFSLRSSILPWQLSTSRHWYIRRFLPRRNVSTSGYLMLDMLMTPIERVDHRTNFLNGLFTEIAYAVTSHTILSSWTSSFVAKRQIEFRGARTGALAKTGSWGGWVLGLFSMHLVFHFIGCCPWPLPFSDDIASPSDEERDSGNGAQMTGGCWTAVETWREHGIAL
ncbi:hypothetical protein EDD18DRAFT_1369944 [Armillaria luteobubalina]|uniref:Uncharacterized protein n=1 Tax=Armillaria luteobubalina TaxID=153913 RepID=A0AA39NVT1_9AGAR|nr:hypothetical protein EDD18DRAFT_1369944 [Armillaria luteobubalina]